MIVKYLRLGDNEDPNDKMRYWRDWMDAVLSKYRGLWMEERERAGNMVVAIPAMAVVMDLPPDEALEQLKRDMAAMPEIRQAYEKYANS